MANTVDETVEVRAPLGASPDGVPREACASGRDFGRYVVGRPLGRGGMGEVVAARDPQLDREVAIKVVSVRGGSLDERREARLRLQQEAQALARLSHPNVVEVYDVLSHDDDIAVVMALVPGETLKQWAQTPRPWSQVVTLMIEAGRGLAAAHAAGVVHRDFKPGNVIVDEHGHARVLDFGLARFAGLGHTSPSSASIDPLLISGPVSTSNNLTVAGVVLGTPAYMAPEQHLGERTDERTDQFAFCVTLHELVYGKRPFAGPSYERLKAAVVAGKLDASLARKAPRRLWTVLSRGLQVNPEHRYPTMQALLDDLERLQRRRSMPAIAALGAVAVAAPVIVGAASSRAEPCTSADAMRASWHAHGKPQGAKAFAEINAFSRTQWARIEPALDRYVEQWRTTYEPACQAQRPRSGTAPAQVRDEMMLCLQSMRRQFESTTAVLAVADHDTVVRAGELVGALPDPATCMLDEVRSRRGVEGPDDAWAARASYAETLVFAGNYKRAQPLVDELVRDTPQSDPRRRARARLVQGILNTHLEDPGDAVATLEDAVALAWEADDGRLAARAAVELTHHLGLDLARYDAAKIWGRYAAAYLQREGNDPELTARLLNALGNIVHKTEQYGAALPYYERALTLLGDDSASALAARTWNDIGSLHFFSARLPEAKEAWQRAHDLWVAALGEEHPDVLIPLNNLGIMLAHERAYDEAEPYFKRVYEGLANAHGDQHPNLIKPLNNLATLTNRMGDCERGLEFGQRALALADDDHPMMPLTLGTLADANHCLGRWDACLDAATRALHLVEVRDGAASWSLELPLRQVAECTFRAGRLEDALAQVERAHRLAELHWGTRRAFVLKTEARTLMALGRVDEAIAVWRQAVKREEHEEPHAVPSSKFELAQVLRSVHGMTAEARALATEARTHYLEAGKHAEAAEIDRWLARR